MAQLRHVAICTKDPIGTADFFVKYFNLCEVERCDIEPYSYVFLTDGHINLALLNFKTEQAAREFHVAGGPSFVGLHHLGFVVEDPAATAARLKAGNVQVVDPPSGAREGVHFEFKAFEPNGILIDISTGWPGAGRESKAS